MQTAKYWAEQAICVQDACNLSGVLHSYLDLVKDLREVMELTNKDLDWVHQHPLSTLFAEKVGHLAKHQSDDFGRFSKAYDWCKKAAANDKPFMLDDFSW